ncbi:MAG: hypothetical protein ACI94Y_003639 [Maribacter sp.]
MILISNSCQPPILASTSFYHWKSYYDISNSEMKYLESLDSKELYLRYFDIGIEAGKAQPLGKLVNKNDFVYPYKIIPTIFITNNTFLKTPTAELDALVDKTSKLLQIIQKKVSKKEITKIQLDCDWTDSTREKYFLFIKKIKEKDKWNISVTIRLHQVKYKKRTGVPPADEFVLMCYNTGELKDIKEKNSILEVGVVKSYTKGMSDYPHQLELALPLFSWGVLFRDGKLIKLIRNVDESTFKDNEKFKVEGNQVKILAGTYLNGYYLYLKDQIRLESVSQKTLEETADILSEHLSPSKIIYYHLDSIIIKRYDHELLENINCKFTYR